MFDGKICIVCPPNVRYVFLCVFVFGCIGTIAPLDDGFYGHGNGNTRIRMPAWMPEWLDINFMVPLIATVIVVAVGILVICVALSRRRTDDFNGGQKDVYCRFLFILNLISLTVI